MISPVRSIADEVVVMKEGIVVEQGPKDVMFSPPHDPYTDLLLPSDPEWLSVKTKSKSLLFTFCLTGKKDIQHLLQPHTHPPISYRSSLITKKVPHKNYLKEVIKWIFLRQRGSHNNEGQNYTIQTPILKTRSLRRHWFSISMA